MADLEALRAHLIDTYGFRAHSVFSFEDDVTLMRDVDDTAWVVRTFGPARSRAAVEGDAAILAWLEQNDYPAERLADPEAVSSTADATVLVTRAVRAVPRSRRRETIKDAGGIRGLGELLGRLHTLELDAEAVRRPGGAWHHMADGSPAAELAVAEDWLTDAQERAGVRELAHFGVLADALEAVDDCAGLPEALIHPDFVLANVVATEAWTTGTAPAMVLVDWAASGRGPRLWSLAFLLFAEGAKDLRRVDLAIDGYRRHVHLETAELDRLASVIAARPLIFDIWRLHHLSRAAADAAAAIDRRRALATAITERVLAAMA
jgi:Ser/Thr protein kinase RdoA (MazF antagonist)